MKEYLRYNIFKKTDNGLNAIFLYQKENYFAMVDEKGKFYNNISRKKDTKEE